ncbi:GAF domain-containing protein [Phyllobacterium endophyticum]|uniref:GAF domain-containing protein n=1 Tax=Phyllobacterium endophyticum TaxID=1149773 RepID=A0A2P7AK89_9HYPH|nr:helix-turn-helix domain-containing protein [Phyllobacterium endophyticum]PSH54607.1 hypothetical protein CU100_25830 [Phyllobacterium endophyticum]TYR40625.1 GAF domain-containing protein [Phyllobacterium endophyticum]
MNVPVKKKRIVGTTTPADRGSLGEELAARLEQILSSDSFDIASARSGLGEAASTIREQSGQQAILTALYETATEIIDVHVVGQVLQAAVNRAKVLLNSDLAYLALYDQQSKGTRVTATVGSVSSDFGSLHVPLGAGMGGKVSQLREPFFTPDYLKDERLVHLPRVDVGIKAEGVRGMVGVPLIARNQFLGALFVADRVVRHYTASEVSWLQALAALIAVALENARLFEREEASLKQTQIAYQSLNARLAASEREASIHRRIVAILERNGSLEELSSVIEKDLNATAGFVPALGGDADVPLEEKSYSSGVGDPAVLTLRVKTNAALTGSDRRILERVVQAAETLLLRKTVRGIEKALVGSAVFQRLMTAGVSVGEATAFRGELQIDLLKPCRIAAFRSGEHSPEALMSMVRQAIGDVPHLVAQSEGVALALYEEGGPVSAESLQGAINIVAGGRVAVGSVLCPEPVVNADKAVRRAINSVDLVVMLGKAGDHTADLNATPEALLLRNAEPDDVAAYIEAALGTVFAYEGSRTGELIATIRAYFAAGLNAAKAAEALGIHYKTVMQRLDRISKIAGIDFKDPRQMFRLQIALFMLGMKGS